MYHSIAFGDKNTWDDWQLVPTSRPFFNPPSLKTKTLDIPGGDGVIDLTEALTGYPVYENRTGSIEFVVMNDFCQPVTSTKEWQEVYSDIMDYLHGQKMIAVLEDDPLYYYEGRFTVSQWQSGQYYSTITIDYDVTPYKWLLYSSLGVWKADPFGMKSSTEVNAIFKSIAVAADGETILDSDSDAILDSDGSAILAHAASGVTYSVSLYGRAPLCPSFVVSTTGGAGVNVKFVNSTLGINSTVLVGEGTTQVSEFVIYGSSVTITLSCVSGAGTVSIDFTQGRL